jgi:hypothetical protein
VPRRRATAPRSNGNTCGVSESTDSSTLSKATVSSANADRTFAYRLQTFEDILHVVFRGRRALAVDGAQALDSQI